MRRNKDEFVSLIETHKRIIFMVCNTYCADSEEQKDLVQEVIIQLWSNFEKYDDRYKVTTWIYRIALNVAISHFRKLLSRRKHESVFAENFVEIIHEEKPETDENIRLLRVFINQLDEMNKALMILFLDGNSHEEIAHILNISVSNVGTKINRIKKKLKQQFKNSKQ